MRNQMVLAYLVVTCLCDVKPGVGLECFKCSDGQDLSCKSPNQTENCTVNQSCVTKQKITVDHAIYREAKGCFTSCISGCRADPGGMLLKICYFCCNENRCNYKLPTPSSPMLPLSMTISATTKVTTNVTTPKGATSITRFSRIIITCMIFITCGFGAL